MPEEKNKDSKYEPQLLELTGTLDEKFKQIYDLYHKKIFNYIIKCIGDREEATDLLQEVFILFYNKLPNLDISTTRIESWLLKVARNYSMSFSRKRYKRPMTGLNENEPTAKSNTDDMFKRKDLTKRMSAFLAQLNERERSIFILHKLEGVKYRDLMEIFDISNRTLKRVVRSVLIKLKDTDLFDADDLN